MKLVEKNISDLVSNAVQPEYRTDPKKIKGLKNSIQKQGLLSPVLITPDGILIDGHRRVACLKELGLKTVPCVMLNGEMKDNNSVSLFRYANEHTLRVTDVAYVEIFLSGGDVPNGVANKILFVTEKLGRKWLKWLVKNNVGPHTIRRHYKIAKSIGLSDPINYGKFIKWVVKHKCTSALTHADAITDGQKIKECIEKDVKFSLR